MREDLKIVGLDVLPDEFDGFSSRNLRNTKEFLKIR